MAIVRRYGKPDLFVTFTCNPAWPEILEHLEEGQKAEDRPDIVNRIFQLKLAASEDEILEQGHHLQHFVFYTQRKISDHLVSFL